MTGTKKKEIVGQVVLKVLAVGCFVIFLACVVAGTGFSGDASSSLLSLPPFLGRPTASSITINLAAGDQPIVCYVKFKSEQGSRTDSWKQTNDIFISAHSPVEIPLQSLGPGTTHRYQVFARPSAKNDFQLVTEKAFRTQRSDSSPFAFAIISDSHITPMNKDRLDILSQASVSILARKPDFFMMLGDNIQTFTSHGGPMTDPRYGPLLYGSLRQGLGDLPSSVPGFSANGNWEGENGWHPAREREWAMGARKAFLPNPKGTTYPQGGSESEDYYGFTWGDALILVLNVTGYTPTDHALSSPIGRNDGWTLGEKQKTWLSQQLSASRARWKLLFIHHTVGGNAGDDMNSRYGRGGGRAAAVGEQALIHRWMQQYGVQALFYGHDHVFTDMTVDGVHYTCVGSAGAPWKFTTEITGYEQYWTPSGYTWVEVGKDSVTVSFVRPDMAYPQGRVLNSYTIGSK